MIQISLKLWLREHNEDFQKDKILNGVDFNLV